MAEFLPPFCNFVLNRSREVIEVSNPMFLGMGNSFAQSDLKYLKPFPRWSKMVDFWPIIACIMITIFNIAKVHIIKSLLEWQGTQCNNHSHSISLFFSFFFISPTHGARLVRGFFYGFQGETLSTCSLHVFLVMPKFSRNRSISNGFQDIDFF